MGQQQLLLIVLVMILVGTAILMGFQIYTETNRETAIDIMSKDLVNLASIALNYYRTPIEIGGGGKSYIASANGGNGQWEVPSNLDSLDNRFYEVSNIASNTIEIMGKSIDEETGQNGVEGVSVYVTINERGVTAFRVEN